MSNNDNNLISNSNASNGTDKPNKGKDNKTMKTNMKTMKTHAHAVLLTAFNNDRSKRSTTPGFKGRCFVCDAQTKQDLCDVCLETKEALKNADEAEKKALLKGLYRRQKANGYFVAFVAPPKRYVLVAKEGDKFAAGTLEDMNVFHAFDEAVNAVSNLVEDLEELYYAPEVITIQSPWCKGLIELVREHNKSKPEGQASLFIKIINDYALKEKAKKENNTGLGKLIKVLDGLADKADKAINPPKDLAAEAAAITVKVENDLFEQLAAAKEAAKAARA